ncbi:MAG: hypothetical protein CM15mP120_02060 [Pseudomonadota bacterium]|nr:MAG: hypothetical protein CM15mP120_02060 [Pseudomonadota bacterium]
MTSVPPFGKAHREFHRVRKRGAFGTARHGAADVATVNAALGRWSRWPDYPGPVPNPHAHPDTVPNWTIDHHDWAGPHGRGHNTVNVKVICANRFDGGDHYGKIPGLQPAITAFIAAFSTVPRPYLAASPQ